MRKNYIKLDDESVLDILVQDEYIQTLNAGPRNDREYTDTL